MIDPYLVKKEIAIKYGTKREFDYWDTEFKKSHDKTNKMWNMFLKRLEIYKHQREIKNVRNTDGNTED